MKLTEKMKKNLAILGGVLIGIGLIAAIGMQTLSCMSSAG